MARIGIGCTTYKRPECLAKWKEQIAKHTFMDDVLIYIAEDTDHDRQGVAKRKNECLRALKDCDYIFLFDDDCYPIKDGWVEFFIESGNKHLLYLNGDLHAYISENGYRDCGGVFMFMAKDVIEKVGAFDEKFSTYGFEHANYSLRVQKYTTTKYAYLCKPQTKHYLFAEDYSNHNHKSSISDEEKKEHVRNNWDKFFKEPIKDIYIPL